MTYEVWMEGYAATGERGEHEKVGEFEAPDFESACSLAADHLSRGDASVRHRYYDPEHLTWWGCRLFDNETDAAEAFG